MVMIDEFQHFYNQDKQKIMYDVADWLKVLIDDTHSVLVVAGLPSCTFRHRRESTVRQALLGSCSIVEVSTGKISDNAGSLSRIFEEFSTSNRQMASDPVTSFEEMAFRFFLATGGLISDTWRRSCDRPCVTLR